MCWSQCSIDGNEEIPWFDVTISTNGPIIAKSSTLNQLHTSFFIASSSSPIRTTSAVVHPIIHAALRGHTFDHLVSAGIEYCEFYVLKTRICYTSYLLLSRQESQDEPSLPKSFRRFPSCRMKYKAVPEPSLHFRLCCLKYSLPFLFVSFNLSNIAVITHADLGSRHKSLQNIPCL